MFYREAGQFKTSYAADQAIFPILQDRIFIGMVLVLAFGVIPFTGLPFLTVEYSLQALLIPVCVFSVAAIGLNILTGYCGQISLGTGGFMAVGAYSAYKLATAFPDLHFVGVFVIAGLITAAVGLFFGLPSLRIKGFYLAVATLAAQFFLEWLFLNKTWFVNHNTSGTITAPPRDLLPFAPLDIPVTGAVASVEARYLVALTFACLAALIAKNLVRGRVGRSWMAIRDMDVAAEVIGIRPLPTKLLAFGVSSFFVGVAGAMMVFLWWGAAEIDSFTIYRSFDVLFMIIIGGLGSILGSFLGAAFIVLTPILLSIALPPLFVAVKEGLATLDVNWNIAPNAAAEQTEFMIFGALMVIFLIAEPAGLARLWSIAKEKLRLWPFPY